MIKKYRAHLTRIIIFVGVLTFLLLLWEFNPSKVWDHLLKFGVGFIFVIPFQIFDHMLNAYGWKLAFLPENANKVSLINLVKVRIAGDGVNYLTPSANIGGEFVRPGMISAPLPQEVKVTSVILAKVTQTVGQVFFILSGIGFLLHAHLFAFDKKQAALGAFGVGGIFLGLVIGLSLLLIEPPAWFQKKFPKLTQKSSPIRKLLKIYLGRHPFRMLSSIALFMIGYCWGAAEIWLICHFLGLQLDLKTVLSIEFLSNLIDALGFWVPAKIGTQEAGKTAIFVGLGLSAELGFTLGLIRHFREILWAGLGLYLYARHTKTIDPV